MIGKIPPEKFWKLYKNLPQELKEVLNQATIGEEVSEICQRNRISKLSEEIMECVTQVLIGLLPPEEFQATLERELKLPLELAKRINWEIYRYIFFPVKNSLAELYKKEAVSPQPPIVPTEKEEKKGEGGDIYREPIE